MSLRKLSEGPIDRLRNECKLPDAADYFARMLTHADGIIDHQEKLIAAYEEVLKSGSQFMVVPIITTSNNLNAVARYRRAVDVLTTLQSK